MLKRILEFLEGPPDTGCTACALQAGNRIDIVALREDGGVELIIKVHGSLDDSPSTQELLEAKIKNYLEQRNSIAFRTEFRHVSSDKTCIVLETDGRLPRAIHALLQRLEPLVQAGQARLVIRGHESRKRDFRGLYFPVLQRRAGDHLGESNSADFPPSGPQPSSLTDWSGKEPRSAGGERLGESGSPPSAA